MVQRELLALFDRDQRKSTRYTGMRREATGTTVRYVNLHGFDGVVLHSELDASSADAAIAEEIRRFTEIGQNFEWKLFTHDEPADLRDRLARAGFRIGAEEIVMLLDLSSLIPRLAEPVACDLRRLEDPALLEDVRVVQEAISEKEGAWTIGQLEAEIRESPDTLSIYAVYVGEKPVSAGWIRFAEHDSPFASLWGGSTLEPFRGRGHYTALVAARAREAIARKVPYLYVDAGPMSRPILEGLGFFRLTSSYPCSWQRP